MEKNILGLMTFLTTIIFAQSQGDIAFVGYNGDKDDDFAIVVLSDIPENSTIYFTDSEPDTSGTGMNDIAEGVITWFTGNTVITSGTVVAFTELDNESNENFGASIGSVTRSDAGFSLATGVDGDEVFATLGNPATGEVTIWLAGIEVHDNGRPENFDKTGLTPGINYLVIDATQSKDGGQYTGTRVGKTLSEYRVLIHDEDQWTTDTSNGEIFVPFDSTSFVFEGLSVSTNSIQGLVLFAQNQKIITNIGEITNIYNMFGQHVVNQNLSQGIYIVNVKIAGKLINLKFAM